MILTVSKRVEFSASRRLYLATLSPAENRQRFGDESASPHGSGRNYVAYFAFCGEPDPTTGMLINISEIKKRAGSVIDDRYDHRFLNEDNASFRENVPSAANIARQLLSEVAPLFEGEPAQLCAVHLQESPARSATAYATGAQEANYWFEFSAARQTLSPHLTAAENQRLFGASVRDHGHNYRARLTCEAESAPAEIARLTEDLREHFDHKHLNHDLPALQGEPVTTESIARLLLRQANARSPILSVRLHEHDDFFVEAWRTGAMFVGMRESFGASHRLHVAQFSEKKNAELFGKCNNRRGHGHLYTAEATVAADYDEGTGAAVNFVQMREAISSAIQPWRDQHLDLDTEEFRHRPSTGENIVAALWARLHERVGGRLHRLRLWETANNCFTLRRT